MSATTTTKDESYLGVGKVWARLYGSTAAMRHVGNVSKLSIKQKLKTIDIKDYTKPGGGTRNKIERIDSVTVDMTWLEFMTENLVLACGGTSSNVPSATVATEPITFVKGGLIRLAHPITSVTEVKTGATTYTEGTDYTVSAGGLFIPDSSTIVDATEGTVTYGHPTYDQVEAGTQMSTELEMFFEGLNEANSDTPMLVELWRVHMPPVDELALLTGSDNPAEMSFSSEALRDATKTAANASQFYRVRKVGAAV